MLLLLVEAEDRPEIQNNFDTLDRILREHQKMCKASATIVEAGTIFFIAQAITCKMLRRSYMRSWVQMGRDGACSTFRVYLLCLSPIAKNAPAERFVSQPSKQPALTKWRI